MAIDSLDIRILNNLNNLKDGEEISVWKIMRRLFPDGLDRENKLIKRRFERMEEMGLFIIEKNSPRRFSMIKDNVIFKKTKFPDRISDSLLLRIKGKWEIFEL